jgi:hypothetical protein
LNATNTGFFFIENSTQKNLRIRFEDMNTEEDADAIMGNDIPSTKDVAKTYR